VNSAIAQMERVVERNASLVDEATQATEAMNAQAAGLLAMTRRFRVDAEGGADILVDGVALAAPRTSDPKPIRFQPAPGPLPAARKRKQGEPARAGEWTAF
jgi:hypothetical protein